MKNSSILKEYTERVEALVEWLPPLEERKKKIEEINEEFYQEYGNNLPPVLLDKLGTWLLREVYADKRVNKIQLEEYPVLSTYQMDRRGRKEVLLDEEETISCLNFHVKNNSTRRAVDKPEE